MIFYYLVTNNILLLKFSYSYIFFYDFIINSSVAIKESLNSKSRSNEVKYNSFKFCQALSYIEIACWYGCNTKVLGSGN